MPRIPKAGDKLNVDDIEMILAAVKKRQDNFPGEPASLSMILVMLNIGDRFSPVECVEQEWTGLKMDVVKPESPDDIPKCPNGHPLLQGNGLKLAWVENV